VGTISMDSITVDLGSETGTANRLQGARAVLIGIQGSQRITAE